MAGTAEQRNHDGRAIPPSRDGVVEHFVLGDVCVALDFSGHVQVIADNRVSLTASSERAEADPARRSIEAHPGPVRATRSATTGATSNIAATLSTDCGPVFCKAIRTTHPMSRMHRMEARVNPWLPDTAPRLRWVVESEGWLPSDSTTWRAGTRT